MKRRFALLIALVFVFAGFASTASAAMISPTVFYQTEQATVLEGVRKDTYQNGLGQIVVQYSGLDSYIDSALAERGGSTASLEVAKKIIKEIRGANMLSILPEEYILEALTYEEVFQTISYIKTSQDGTAQYMQEDEIMKEVAKIKQTASSAQSELPSDFVNDRTSSDGYMRLVTTAVRVSDPPTCYDDRNHYYLISVYSEWLIMPTYTYEDLLALAYGTAVYDDNYGVYACISQSEACKFCDYTDSYYYDEIYRNDTPDYSKPEASDYLEIDFPGGRGVSCYVNFVKQINLCNHYIEEADTMMGGSYTTEMSSYLQTRVYSQSWDFEVRAGYSHKWTGIGSISVSFSTEGPSISFSSFWNTTDYFGTPLTVTYLSSVNPSFPSPFSKRKE